MDGKAEVSSSLQASFDGDQVVQDCGCPLRDEHAIFTIRDDQSSAEPASHPLGAPARQLMTSRHMNSAQAVEWERDRERVETLSSGLEAAALPGLASSAYGFPGTGASTGASTSSLSHSSPLALRTRTVSPLSLSASSATSYLAEAPEAWAGRTQASDAWVPPSVFPSSMFEAPAKPFLPLASVMPSTFNPASSAIHAPSAIGPAGFSSFAPQCAPRWTPFTVPGSAASSSSSSSAAAMTFAAASAADFARGMSTAQLLGSLGTRQFPVMDFVAAPAFLRSR